MTPQPTVAQVSLVKLQRVTASSLVASQGPFVCSGSSKGNSVCNGPSWDQAGLRQGHEHIHSSQTKMPGNVAGCAEGGQESSVPSLPVTAGGWMDFVPRNESFVCSKHTNLHPAIFLGPHFSSDLSVQLLMGHCWWGTALI